MIRFKKKKNDVLNSKLFACLFHHLLESSTDHEFTCSMQILNTSKADNKIHFLNHKQKVRNKFYPFDTHSPSEVRHNKVLVCNETNKISVYCAINCKRKLQKQCELEPKRNITLKPYFAMQWEKEYCLSTHTNKEIKFRKCANCNRF